MIIKALSRKSGTGQLLEYLLKEEKTSCNGHKKLVVKHNLRARKVATQTKEFEKNEALRLYKRKDAVAIHHTILSLSKLDKAKVNDNMLRSFAKEFIRLRGKDSLHLVVAHYNTDAIHLHCVTSGTKYLTGKGNRLSKVDFRKLKEALIEFQQTKYPQLSHSLPSHGSKVSDKPNLPFIVRANNRMSQKEALIKTIEACYATSKSQTAFLAALNKQGYEPYYRGSENRLAGVKAENGRKFRLNKLGYDVDKLAQLDNKLLEEKELDELRNIRDQQARHYEHEDDNSPRTIDEDVDLREDEQERPDADSPDRDYSEKENEDEEVDDTEDWER